MSWADVSAALRLGARPEEVVSRARTLFRRTEEGVSSPPPSTTAAGLREGGDVSRLYREIDGQQTQLCYIRPPLPVLEMIDGEKYESRIQFDRELCFDVLAMFKPRLIAPVSTKLQQELLDAPPPRAETSRRALRRRSREMGRMERARSLSRRQWAMEYAEYARDTKSNRADAARTLLRDAPSIALASYILARVVPTLNNDDAIRVAAAAASAASMCGGALAAADVAIAVESRRDTSSGLEVLGAVIR